MINNNNRICPLSTLPSHRLGFRPRVRVRNCVVINFPHREGEKKITHTRYRLNDNKKINIKNIAYTANIRIQPETLAARWMREHAHARATHIYIP